MRSRPKVVAFDVIGTVFSLDALRGRLEGAGLAGQKLSAWIAQTLRDGFALAATETFAPFREVAAASLTRLLIEEGRPASTAALEGVLDGFAELDPYPDASAAFERLRGGSVRIFALTNGSPAATGELLRRSGLDRFVEQVISVESVRQWKPRPQVYRHAVQCAGVAAGELALVAAHAWDVHGAARAGVGTVYVARGQPYPAFMAPPHAIASNLVQAAEALVKLAPGRA